MTGIALTIAGSVLHGNQKEGDLVVLMYIGVLLVLVCILLLSVHCCVRRNVKERKRALRLSLMDGSRRIVHPGGGGGDFTSIPVHDFTPDPHYRNSYLETNLNDIEGPENARPFLNVMTNPSYHHYQHRQNTLSRTGGGLKMNSCDPRLSSEMSERHVYDWGRNHHVTGVHRPYR